MEEENLSNQLLKNLASARQNIAVKIEKEEQIAKYLKSQLEEIQSDIVTMHNSLE